MKSWQKMANSDFGTLEALAADLADAIRTAGAQTSRAPAAPPHKWQIKIKLEKPIAVPLAEGAGIEFISGPVEDS